MTGAFDDAPAGGPVYPGLFSPFGFGGPERFGCLCGCAGCLCLGFVVVVASHHPFIPVQCLAQHSALPRCLARAAMPSSRGAGFAGLPGPVLGGRVPGMPPGEEGLVPLASAGSRAVLGTCGNVASGAAGPCTAAPVRASPLWHGHAGKGGWVGPHTVCEWRFFL